MIQFLEADTAVSRFLWVIILILVVLICVYYFFILATLQARECSAMDGLYKQINGNLRSLNSGDPVCQYTLKDYYIKTAYNCCSGGSYKNDFVSICILRDVLKQGIRALDFEIYSIGDNPVVATSILDSYYIKQTYNYVLFSEVMSTIQNYAFSNSNCPNPTDPIIIHLRIKSANPHVFTNLAAIFESVSNLMLDKSYSYENLGKNLGDEPLLSLLGKIVLVVDRTNTNILNNTKFMEYVNMTSNSVFMRGLTITQVVNSPDLQELQTFNQKNMTIAMPDSGISNPPNPNGIVARAAGCQFIAQRYQYVDRYLEENTFFFDTNGYAFVLKPENLRFVPVRVAAPVPQNPDLNYAPRKVSSDYYSFNI
jgi:hypothetical protein